MEFYGAFSPELRKQVEARDIIHTLNVVYDEWRFGKPATFKSINSRVDAIEMNKYAKTLPRALHPAVWTRQDGRKVMHVSPWMAEGLAGQETPEGDAQLEAVAQEVYRKAKAYFHRWKPTGMLNWDNWRMLHCVSGSNPNAARRMQRTTIKGDYGLDRFEAGAQGDALLTDTMV